MHDLLLAKQIMDIVLKEAEKKKLKKISRISVGFGKNISVGHDHPEEITSENLKFNLKLLIENTPARGAKIVIRQIKNKNGIINVDLG